MIAPDGARIDIGAPLSPDGRTLAFIAFSNQGQPLIFVRPLDSATPRPLPGTEQAQRLFWSPDSPTPLFRPSLAFAGPPVFGRSYSVSDDGRFLVNVSSTDPLGRPITVVVNWGATLNK